jgi:hypothetical protein
VPSRVDRRDSKHKERWIQALIEELVRITGAPGVLTEPAVVDAYATDWPVQSGQSDPLVSPQTGTP